MNHHTDAASAPHQLNYTTGSANRRQTLFQVGAGLGIAGCCVSLLIFLGLLFGFNASLFLSPLPLVMGAVGLVLSVVGAVLHGHMEGPSVVAALFINVAAMIGGSLELLMWMWKPMIG